MRLLYLMVDDVAPDADRLDLRTRLGQAMMPPGSEFVARGLPFGPRYYHESAIGQALCVPGVLQVLRQAEGEFDAAVMGCFADSAVREARVAASIPIIGAGQSSVALAQTLGDGFGVVTILPSNVPDIERLIAAMRVSHLCAGVRAIGLDAAGVTGSPGEALRRTGEAALDLIERGAQVIVLGCLSYSFTTIAVDLGERLGLPVVDPLWAAIAVAHAQVLMGVRPSRQAHPPLEAADELHDYLDLLARSHAAPDATIKSEGPSGREPARGGPDASSS